jgi:hypothetical protein
MVESHTDWGVGFADSDRDFLQRLVWLSRAICERHHGWFYLLPLLVSISFFLIADLDSPRNGVIHVKPQNLNSVSDSVR